jgi:hypothetical protein
VSVQPPDQALLDEYSTCGIDIKASGRKPQVRRCKVMVGLSPEVAYDAHNPDVYTAASAIYGRMFRVQNAEGQMVPVPKPERGSFDPDDEFMTYMRKSRHFATVRKVSHREVIDCYTGRRRECYERARVSLNLKRLEDRDSRLTTFVKCEKINFSAKPNAIPRCINPRSPRFNLELARYIKQLEKPCFRAIDSLFNQRRPLKHKTVMKGLNARDLGNEISRVWRDYSNPVAVRLDAKRFDQHVSVQALQYEHSLWLSLFTGEERSQLEYILNGQLLNQCVCRCRDGTIRFMIPGMRMSGDMNTSSGNVILMCSMMHAFLNHLDAKYGALGISLINNGDDCLLIGEREVTNHVVAEVETFFLRYGFEMDIEGTTDVLERAKFCQTHMLDLGRGDTVAVRSYPESIAKDCVSFLSINNDREFDSWRKAVGECGMSLCSGVPIFQEFYSCLLRGVGDVKANHGNSFTGAQYLALGMQGQYIEPTTTARVSFWKAFGVLPSMQRTMENIYRNYNCRYHPVYQCLEPSNPLWTAGMLKMAAWVTAD